MGPELHAGAGLAQKALGHLGACWPGCTASDVRLLCRCPSLPDGVVGLARDIYAYLEKKKGKLFRTTSAPSAEPAPATVRTDRG